MDCGLEGLTFRAPSLVKPEFAAECDIRNIVTRFLRTGQLPQMKEPVSLDATKFPEDFQALQNNIAAVRQRFEMLPESERMKYGNDPEVWLAAQAEEAAKPADKAKDSEPAGDPPPNTPPSGEGVSPAGTPPDDVDQK